MRLFTCLIFLVLQFQSLGQLKYDYNWTFGEFGGVLVNFQNDNVSIENFDKDFKLASANTSMSNSEGDFLFYSNGCRVYNRNFEIMLNGDSLGLPGNYFCMDQDFGNPLVQNVIALPIDENDEFYYLMHHDFTFDSKDTSSFYLTTIDMKGDNGLGEVINKREVVFTDAISRSGFEITRHNNGVDWWVVVPRYESNCYHVLLLTEDGIVSDDLQCLGTSWNFNDVQGQMDFSPDGSKFARFIYEHGLNIFDFDNEHGLFSNPLRIDFSFTNVFFHAGVFFSPNSRFVYASAFSDVFQYDLAESDVSNSRIKVATLNTPDSIMLNTRFTRGALGPNGKIYIGGSFEFNHLHVIHNPDCKGVQCDVEQYAIKLDEFPNSSALGIPHIPHFRNQPQEIDCDTVSIMTSTSDFEFQNLEHDVYPNPVSDILYIEVADLPFGFVFKVYDVLGKEMLIGESSSNSLQIDMSTVVEGIYFYKILDKNNIVANGKLQKISH